MFKFIRWGEFERFFIDDEGVAHKGYIILNAMLEARYPRLLDMSKHMPAEKAANFKMFQRFLAQTAPQEVLLHLFDGQAQFVMVIPPKCPALKRKRLPKGSISSFA